jgi:hypothetical protein
MPSVARNTAWREQAAKNRYQAENDSKFVDDLIDFAFARGDPYEAGENQSVGECNLVLTFLTEDKIRDNYQNISAPSTHVSLGNNAQRYSTYSHFTSSPQFNLELTFTKNSTGRFKI